MSSAVKRPKRAQRTLTPNDTASDTAWSAPPSSWYPVGRAARLLAGGRRCEVTADFRLVRKARRRGDRDRVRVSAPTTRRSPTPSGRRQPRLRCTASHGSRPGSRRSTPCGTRAWGIYAAARSRASSLTPGGRLTRWSGVFCVARRFLTRRRSFRFSRSTRAGFPRARRARRSNSGFLSHLSKISINSSFTVVALLKVRSMTSWSYSADLSDP